MRTTNRGLITHPLVFTGRRAASYRPACVELSRKIGDLEGLL